MDPQVLFTQALTYEEKRTLTAAARGGLSVGQEVFAQAVAAGAQLTEAYRKGFRVGTKVPTKDVREKAAALMRNPRIADRIEEVISEKERASMGEASKIRQFVIDRLKVEAIDAPMPAARVRALELLGKIDIVQLFTEKAEKPKEDKPSDVMKEIESRLTKIIGLPFVNAEKTIDQEDKPEV